MIMPSQVLFVEQSPQQADSHRAKAQPASGEAQRAAGSVGGKAVEVDKAEVGPALPGGLASGDREEQTVEHRDQDQQRRRT